MKNICILILLFGLLFLINCIDSKDVVPRSHNGHGHQNQQQSKSESPHPINPCVHGDYDFSGFANKSSYQYTYTDPSDNQDYTLYWNICGKNSAASKCRTRYDAICEQGEHTYRVLGNTYSVSFQEFVNGDKYDKYGGVLTYTSEYVQNCPNGKSTVHISLFCDRFGANRILSVKSNHELCETSIHMVGDSGCPVIFKPIYKIILVVSAIIIVLVGLLTVCTYCIHLLHKQYHDRKKRLAEQSQPLLINGEAFVTPGNDDLENNWK